MTLQQIQPLADAAAPASRSPGRRALRRFGRNKGAVMALLLLIMLSLGAALAPVIAPFPPNQMSLRDRMQPPGLTHLLGTDENGRDVFSRLINRNFNAKEANY